MDNWFKQLADSHEARLPSDAWEEFQGVWQNAKPVLYKRPSFWYAAASLMGLVSLFSWFWLSAPTPKMAKIERVSSPEPPQELSPQIAPSPNITSTNKSISKAAQKDYKTPSFESKYPNRKPETFYPATPLTKAMPTTETPKTLTQLSAQKGEKLLAELPHFQINTSPQTITTVDSSQIIPSQKRVLQFGLVSPLCSNGKEAFTTQNTIAISLLMGASSASKGMALAGLANYSRNTAEGTQIAGMMNYTEQLNGGQISGLSNIIGGKELAQSLDSIAPLKTKENKFQLAGVSNTDLSQAPNSLQIAGIMNKAKNIKGAQIAGVFNSAEEVNGLQLSAGLNVAGKLKGSQIGIVNISKETDGGTPVGLLSIVKKNGYQRLEIWGNETFHTNFALKMGVRKFYNIFAIGGQFNNDRLRWGVGYGFGTCLTLNPTLDLNIDLLSYHVNEVESRWTRELNQLTQIRSIFVAQGKDFKLLFGPSVNIFVSDYLKDGVQASNLAPWTFYNGRSNITRMRMWLGVNLGVQL